MVVGILRSVIFLVIIVNLNGLPAPPIPTTLQRRWEENAGAVEGDMFFAPTKSRGVAIRRVGTRWANGIVPYQFLPGFTAEQQAFIEGVLRKMESVLTVNNVRCIQFQPKTVNDQYYISIMNGNGCSSYVGMPSYPSFNHTVSLNSAGCLDNGRIMHEMLHTLGFLHEQSRPDRDSYVRVNEANINPNMLHNFDKMNDVDVDTQNTAYDYESVMHYETDAFSMNGLPTIEPLQAYVKIGQRYYMSPTDIQEVRLFYNCPTSGVTLPPTTTTTTTANPNTITSTYIGALAPSTPRYFRPNGAPGSYYYEIIEISVTTPGLYYFTGSSLIDTYGYLYISTFDPSNPSPNVWVQNDDGNGDRQFRFRINFGSSYTLTLVVTTYNPQTTGAYSVFAIGPALVTFVRRSVSLPPTAMTSTITSTTTSTTTKVPTRTSTTTKSPTTTSTTTKVPTTTSTTTKSPTTTSTTTKVPTRTSTTTKVPTTTSTTTKSPTTTSTTTKVPTTTSTTTKSPTTSTTTKVPTTTSTTTKSPTTSTTTKVPTTTSTTTKLSTTTSTSTKSPTTTSTTTKLSTTTSTSTKSPTTTSTTTKVPTTTSTSTKSPTTTSTTTKLSITTTVTIPSNRTVSCEVVIPSNALIYPNSLLYGNNSFGVYNWICQGVTLSTYGNGLGTFYLEENAFFYGNGGGSHIVYLKKGANFVSGGGGGHTIYYEDGAKYDGAGNTVTRCSSLAYTYKNIDSNSMQCVNKNAPFIPTAPPTPTTTKRTPTTTTPRMSTSAAQNTSCLVRVPAPAFVYSSSAVSVQTTYHEDIWLCNRANITYGGWGGGYSYLERNAVVYGGGGGSRTVFMKAGARYYSQGGGSHNIYYEQGAQFDGAGFTRLCSQLIFQYSSTGGCS